MRLISFAMEIKKKLIIFLNQVVLEAVAGVEEASEIETAEEVEGLEETEEVEGEMIDVADTEEEGVMGDVTIGGEEEKEAGALGVVAEAETTGGEVTEVVEMIDMVGVVEATEVVTQETGEEEGMDPGVP